MKIEVKIAIIGAVAVILAGLIGIVPDILKVYENGETPEDTDKTSEKMNVEVVKIKVNGGGWCHGFHTGKGYIITISAGNLTPGKTVPISWVSTNRQDPMTAVVEGKGSMAPYATLLRIQENNWSKYTLKTRISRSLNKGDKVVRYISDYDSVPGTVIDIVKDTKIEKGEIRGALITSPIMGPGGAGAPVLDENGNLVGMGYGGDPKTKSISVPIENIKVSFPYAF